MEEEKMKEKLIKEEKGKEWRTEIKEWKRKRKR